MHPVKCCILGQKYIFKSSIKVYGKIVTGKIVNNSIAEDEYVRYSLDEGFAMAVDNDSWDPVYENVFYCPFCGEKLE